MMHLCLTGNGCLQAGPLAPDGTSMRTELQMMHLYLTGIMMIAIMRAGPLAANGTSMTMSDDAVDVLVASNFSATSVLPALGSPEAQFQQLMMNVLWDYGYTVGCVTLHQPCAGALHWLGKVDGWSAVVNIGA